MADEPSQTCDGQSNSSKEETNSSGYVSEGSNDMKNEEKHELIKTSEITVNVDEKKKDLPKVETEDSTDKREDSEKLELETEENKTIKQSPVPKPPRLGTPNSARLDPQAYINFEIKPTDKEKADIKQDLEQNETIKPSTDTKVPNDGPKMEHKTSRNESQNTNQLKTSSLKNTNKDENTNQLDKRTTSTLPKLPSTDKRKAPEPPDLTTKEKKMSEKGSKKGECHLNFCPRAVHHTEDE